MGQPPPLAAKLRLLLIRERELLAVRQELQAHQRWMARLQRITAAMATSADLVEAWELLAWRLVGDSPYEFAAVVPEDGPPVVRGGVDAGRLLDAIAGCGERWADVAVVERDDPDPAAPAWLLGGRTRGDAGEGALLVVGRTRRTVGYFPGPWTADADHLGYLVETLTHALAAVRLRAALTAERNSLQSQVEHATRSLQLALDDAQTARETAEAASRAKSVFLAKMSHELRTPLNAIIGYSELIAAEAVDAGLTAYVDDLGRIHRSGRHLLSLIADILDLSKIEAGRMEVRAAPFDAVEVIRAVCATLDALAGSRGNTLIAELPDQPVPMDTDETKFRQILVNLVGNAAKFTDDGWITVALTATDDEVALTVADTGIGMGPRLLARLFEPFHQGEEAVEGRPSGSGLGLAICRQFCTLLGGEIEVSSSPGEGSRFDVRLPRRL